MTDHFRAEERPGWQARVVARHSMTYREGASQEEDRPPHVRAASGLSSFREYIAVIQDDANWLALIDGERRVTAVPLPPSVSGDRVFSKERGNRSDKYDLEACVTVEGEHGLELIGFSSGSRRGRQWLLRVRECGPPRADGLPDLAAEFVPVGSFYESMRRRTDFTGAGLNIEGALSLGGNRVRLFQRGNAEACDGLHPVDATADFNWPDLCRHLEHPDEVPPPELSNVRTYDLGELGGVRLTFSDAELLEGGRVLYSASAEDPASGDIRGSVLGIIEESGDACWASLAGEDGNPFTGKIEGLTRDPHDPDNIFFVVDNDDPDSPSFIFEAELSEQFWKGD